MITRRLSLILLLFIASSQTVMGAENATNVAPKTNPASNQVQKPDTQQQPKQQQPADSGLKPATPASSTPVNSIGNLKDAPKEISLGDKVLQGIQDSGSKASNKSSPPGAAPNNAANDVRVTSTTTSIKPTSTTTQAVSSTTSTTSRTTPAGFSSTTSTRQTTTHPPSSLPTTTNARSTTTLASIPEDKLVIPPSDRNRPEENQIVPPSGDTNERRKQPDRSDKDGNVLPPVPETPPPVQRENLKPVDEVPIQLPLPPSNKVEPVPTSPVALPSRPDPTKNETSTPGLKVPPPEVIMINLPAAPAAFKNGTRNTPGKAAMRVSPDAGKNLPGTQPLSPGSSGATSGNREASRSGISDTASSNGSQTTPLIVGVIIGGVVMAAAIGGFVHYMKSKQASQTNPSESAPKTDITPSPRLDSRSSLSISGLNRATMQAEDPLPSNHASVPPTTTGPAAAPVMFTSMKGMFRSVYSTLKPSHSSIASGNSGDPFHSSSRDSTMPLDMLHQALSHEVTITMSNENSKSKTDSLGQKIFSRTPSTVAKEAMAYATSDDLPLEDEDFDADEIMYSRSRSSSLAGSISSESSSDRILPHQERISYSRRPTLSPVMETPESYEDYTLDLKLEEKNFEFLRSSSHDASNDESSDLARLAIAQLGDTSRSICLTEFSFVVDE